MDRIILVSTRPEDRRMALLEDGRLYEFYQDIPGQRGVSNNIYVGRVQRVMPGLSAAFVDIGLGRPGYLNIEGKSVKKGLVAGGDILVQAISEPLANKGAKLTDRITLAGQYIAVEPGSNGIGISRKIRSTPERKRLREILEDMAPDDYRLVARTAADGRDRLEIRQDLEFLQAQWIQIQAKSGGTRGPSLIFNAQDLLMTAARDLVTLGCKRLVLDREEDYDRVLKFVDSVAPDLDQAVEFYQGPEPLFTRWKLVDEIARIPQRVIDMGTKGSLVIDRAEALTAIDVNTGSHVTSGDREDAFFSTNMAAVKEIARQLRLRNIGGLVMIDLVTMGRVEHNDEVFLALRAEMRNDRAHSTILPVSALGVIEMARQKANADPVARMTIPCEVCQGMGRHVSPREVASRALDAANARIATRGPGRLVISAHPGVIETLGSLYAASLEVLESKAGFSVGLVPVSGFDANSFEVEHQRSVK